MKAFRHYSRVIWLEENSRRRKGTGTGGGIEASTVELDGARLRFLRRDDGDHKRTLMFIHGAPGSSGAYQWYLRDTELALRYRMVAVDRPGYGGSKGFYKQLSIDEQARLLATLVEEERRQGREIIMIGHSFGGPIAARIAMQQHTAGLVLIAAAIDPDRERMFWLAPHSLRAPLKWITPNAIKVAAREKLNHAEELANIRDEWKQIDCRTLVIHGSKDMIVPKENVEFAQDVMNEEHLEVILLDGENHFVPWTRKHLIKSILLDW